MECLAQGISLSVNLSIGTITLFISIGVLLFWLPLNQKPGIGTILNALIIAVMIDICIKFVPTPEKLYSSINISCNWCTYNWVRWRHLFSCKFGAGPRDGLMVGLQKKTNMPIAAVRAFLEITVVTIGWYLGGTVGVGTLLFAFGDRSSSCFRLYLTGKIFN